MCFYWNKKVRLTGGEPLVREGVVDLIKKYKQNTRDRRDLFNH